MSSLSKLTKRGHRDHVIYMADGKTVTLVELRDTCEELECAIDGGLLMVKALSEMGSEDGHTFTQLFMAKMALKHALDRLDDITPRGDKKGRDLYFNRETGKYELE